jgi:hypothetical protein
LRCCCSFYCCIQLLRYFIPFIQVLHHLGDLEAFCVRVQVALQRRERERMEENVSKRRLTSDGKDNHGEEAEDDEGAEQFGAEKDVQPAVASKQRVVAVAASAKAPSPQLKISIPDIRDDDDAYCPHPSKHNRF